MNMENKVFYSDFIELMVEVLSLCGSLLKEYTEYWHVMTFRYYNCECADAEKC